MPCSISRHNQLAEAEDLFRQILAVYPDQADVLHLLGGVYLQARKLGLAEKHVRQALAVRDEPAFSLTLGVVLQDAHRPEEALALYRELVKKHPELAEAQVHLGVVQSVLGQFEEAAKAFQEAMRITPGAFAGAGESGDCAVPSEAV